VRLRSRALLAAALALGTALATACGNITTPAPPSSSTAGSATAALPTGSQYAKYYKPNGSATLLPNKTLTVQLSNYKFTPNTLTVASGTAVTLDLQNTASAMPHNFSLDAWSVSVNVSPGQSATTSFTPNAPGTYYFYCNVPGHAQLGMVGRLIVTAAAAGAASSSSSAASPSSASVSGASSAQAAAGASSSATAVSVAPRSSTATSSTTPAVASSATHPTPAAPPSTPAASSSPAARTF
jgi:plastocyanin